MSEFTKGTWEAGIDTSSMLPYVWTKLKNVPAKIAVMHRCPYIKDKEQLANARLIAAAPEMYNWLKTISEIFDKENIINASGIKELLARIDGEDEWPRN